MLLYCILILNVKHIENLNKFIKQNRPFGFLFYIYFNFTVSNWYLKSFLRCIY